MALPDLKLKKKKKHSRGAAKDPNQERTCGSTLVLGKKGSTAKKDQKNGHLNKRTVGGKKKPHR